MEEQNAPVKQSTLALERLKSTMAALNTPDSQPTQPASEDHATLPASQSTKEYLDQLRQTKELEALKQKLVEKEQELKQKEEFLEARNRHILEKAKARRVDLDGDGVDDVEVMVDETGNLIKEVAPKVINPGYKGVAVQPAPSRQLLVPQPQPEYRVHTETLLTKLGDYLGETKVTLDNISSVVSQSMMYASDFADLSGSKKRAVVLNAVGNIAITQANSPGDAKLNMEFVSRSAGTFIDALCAANRRQVVYVPENKGQPSCSAGTGTGACDNASADAQQPAPTPGEVMQQQIVDAVAGGEKIHKDVKRGVAFFACCSTQSAE